MDADKQHHCAQVLFLLPHSNDSMDSTLSEVTQCLSPLDFRGHAPCRYQYLGLP